MNLEAAKRVLDEVAKWLSVASKAFETRIGTGVCDGDE